MRVLKILIVALAFVGVAGSVLYGVLAGINGDLFGVIGAISTVLSIVLAVASIWYGYKTNCKTEKTLEEIRGQNDKLVRKINKELSKDNFNDDNVANIRDHLSKNTPS